MDEKIEQDDLEVQEDEELEEEDPVEDDEEENIDWKERALKAESAIQKAKKAEKKQKPKDTPKDLSDVGDDIRADIEQLKQSERKRQFGYRHGLSPEETDKVFQYDPNPTKETLDDAFLKAGLQAIRKKKRVRDATPTSGGAAAILAGKKFKEMDDAEKQQEFQKFVQSRVAK